MRILIIEDDREIAANLYDYLSGRGHAVDHAADGVTGLHMAVTHDYDVLLLDISLPGMNGLDLCRRLRSDARRDTPVLMLTARDTLNDKLAGFEQGADDYLVKPFALKEVEARLEALHRRHQGKVAPSLLQVDDLAFDTESMRVTRAGEAIRLPPKCLRLLEILMRAPDKVFARHELEQSVWGEDLPNSDTLRAHLHQLRRALARDGRPELIENIPSLGYRLRPVDGR
ncbi:MAG: response regulator transcription factor [Pseudomonadota bacterium]